MVAVVAAVTAPAQAAAKSGDSPVLQAAPPPQVLEAAKFKQKLNARLPLNEHFTDARGRDVKLGDLFGKRPVILDMGYLTCPMLCPAVTNVMINSLTKLKRMTPGKDYDVIFLSIDPKDTPTMAMKKKKKELERFGDLQTAPGWHVLTGTKKAAKAVGDAIGFEYAYDPQTHQYAHAAGFTVITPSGHVSKYFYGLAYPAPELRHALKTAGNGSIGSSVVQLLLRCCAVYDPASGTYSADIMKIMRSAGILTVILIGGGIGFATWRERRRRKRDQPPTDGEDDAASPNVSSTTTVPGSP